jgi:hypothetical protein
MPHDAVANPKSVVNAGFGNPKPASDLYSALDATKRRSGKSTDLLKLFGTGTEEKRRA